MSTKDDSLASLRAPFDTEEPREKVTPKPQNDNFKGVVTAGWILAFILPVLGVFLNVWLFRNADKYDYSKSKAAVPALISIVLTVALLVWLLTFIIGFASPPVSS